MVVLGVVQARLADVGYSFRFFLQAAVVGCLFHVLFLLLAAEFLEGCLLYVLFFLLAAEDFG